MAARLGWNGYGKSEVRLVRVTREGSRHALTDLTVAIALEGDFEEAHTRGDNERVLPTDTMKNTVYAFAKERDPRRVEAFGLELARHFLEASPHAGRVRVSIAAHGWHRLSAGGEPHEHAFERGSQERRLARLAVSRGGGEEVEAGVEELVVLKTTRSGFENFPRDRYTTLKETSDRIFATSIRAVWRYGSAPADFDATFESARTALLETFADHDSLSVQHTLYAMGEAVLSRCQEVSEISLSLPNRHHLLVDLAPFGLENANEVFVATTEPYGLIEAVVTRG
jgi:urate oxidase